MYTPRAFAESDLAALDALITTHPFVTLVTTDDNGVPVATHLPVLYRRTAESILIEGHRARPNPQCTHSGNALLIVHGPQAYISPGWYPDKETAARVPTWNYAVAHLGGTLDTFDDDVSLADHVARLSTQFETAVGSDWQFEPDRADHFSQLRGIVGFRFRPTRIEMKFKLSQNHPPANVQGAIAGLQSFARPDALAVADLMQQRLRSRATD